MNIGAHQQHCATNRIESDQVPFRSQIIHAQPAMVAPSVAVEGGAAKILHAVRLHDVFSGGQQSPDQIRWVIYHVHVEP